MIDKILKLCGVDTHILSTLIMRLWGVCAGGVMIIFIPNWLTQAEQGYYFTFSSLIALQVFFELGFNYVVVQLVGHEMANVKFTASGELVGSDVNLDRMSSLIKMLIKWYRLIAVLFFLVVGGLGVVFFHYKGLPDVRGWLFGWLLIAFFSAINLFYSPFLAVAEGSGRVGNVARLRMIQSILGYVPLWIALSFGAGLWAIPCLTAANAMVTAYWLYNGGRFVFEIGRREIISSENKVCWRTEIFPFQWKIALSWVSGYFIFQLFNPIVFANQGPIMAGKVGMALAIFSTLLGLSMSWVSAKIPVLAGHIARGERKALNTIFWGLVLRSGIFNIFCCCTALLAFYIMKNMEIKLGNRVSDMPILYCIALVTVVNHFIFSVAVYMRAHKEEPMLVSSIVVGILTLLAVFFGAKQSAFMALFLYSMVTLCVGFPWAMALFKRFYSR